MTLKKATVLTLFLWLLAGCTSVTAQDYRAYARRYGIESGLPHRQVNALLEDRRGFIWAATGTGIVRFDGYRFTTLTQPDNGLTATKYVSITEDAAGFIWAFSPNSEQHIATVDIIDPVSCKVIPGVDFFKKHPVPVPYGRIFVTPRRTPDGTLYFGLSQPAGWVSYHPDRGWKTVLVQPEARELNIVAVTGQNRVWGLMKTNDHNPSVVLAGMDENGREIKQFAPAPGNKFRYYEGYTGEPNSFFLIENAPDWHQRIFWKVDSGGERTEVYPPVSPLGESTGILALLADKQIWFNELRVYADGEIILDLKKLYPELTEHKQVCWWQDRQQRVWVGTAFGLILVDIRKDLFKRILYDEKAPAGTGIACRGLLAQNGQLLVNTDGGTRGRYKADWRNGQVTQLTRSGTNYGITADQGGRIWTDGIGKKSGTELGISQIDPQSGALVRAVPIDAVIWHIFPENENRFFLGASKGVFLLHLQNQSVTNINGDQFPELATANVMYIGRDRQANVWACTETGFYRIDPAAGQVVERYWTGGDAAHRLPFDDVLHFYEDNNGIFWIGTRGAGLLQWNRKTGEQHLFYRNNGFLNGNIYAVYEDDFDHLWMSSDYGIIQFNKKTNNVRHTWLTADGVAQDEFNRISHTKSADGTLFFGGLNGVTAFHPKVFYSGENTGKSQLPLVLSNLFLLNEDGEINNQTAEVYRSGVIELRPGDRYVQIEFALLDFANAPNVNYAWKIEGLDADWNYLTKPELRLSSLPDGDYQLRVRSKTADGELAGNELQFHLHVLPPFYLRTWFIILVTCLFGAGFTYWQRRNKWEREKLERLVLRATAKIEEDKKVMEQQATELRHLDEAKSRFFANISHELRTPLTLMLGPLNSAAARIKDIDPTGIQLINMAQTHGENLLGLVNQILDLSKLEAGKLELQESTVWLSQEIKSAISMFESMAAHKGIRLRFLDHTSQELWVQVDAYKLKTILNNLLSNAVKFTPANGEVTLEADYSSSLIRIKVADTGRGIHPDDLPHIFDRYYQTAQPGAPMEGGTGIGLALSQELATLMGGQLTVKSQPGKGSVFALAIPAKIADGVLQDIPEVEAPGPDLPEPQNGFSPPETQVSVLVVEDNPDLSSYLELLLGEKFQVTTAANGRLALDLLEKGGQVFQLIISDLMMPVMDGYQLLAVLKSDPRFQGIPVVMLTARADAADKLQALRIGVDDYLIKPFDAEELLVRVDNLIRNYQNRAVPVWEEMPAEEPATVDAHEEDVTAPDDQEWLERLEKIVRDGLGNFDLNAEDLAMKMYISRSQLYRRVKQLTGLNVSDYIQEIRFQQAKMLLEQKKYTTVKAVALSVGFKHTNNFANNYKKRFGKSPSSYFGHVS